MGSKIVALHEIALVPGYETEKPN